MSEVGAFVSGLTRVWQYARSKTQLTLGGAIDLLAALPDEAQVGGLVRPHSYRGYYCDLAVEDVRALVPAAQMHANLVALVGQVFEGYKGGEYTATRATPLWRSRYGEASGDRIMGLVSGCWTYAQEVTDSPGAG